MMLRDELRALRDDPRPQHAAQRAMRQAAQEWRRRESAVLDEMEAFGSGVPLEDCPALHALFAPGDAASRLAGGFIAAQAAALAGHPLGHVAFHHFCDGVRSTLLLARSGTATLTLVAIDGAGTRAGPAPADASFAPSDHWEHVLAGEASAELVEREGKEGAAPSRRPLCLAQGSIVRRDADRQALVLREVRGRLVSLRLQRPHRADAKGPASQAKGAAILGTAPILADRRAELALVLLGRMGGREAAPLMAELSRRPGPPGLRWRALRECLMLDARTGFAALVAVAKARSDPLRGSAQTLRRRLTELHPQLAESA